WRMEAFEQFAPMRTRRPADQQHHQVVDAGTDDRGDDKWHVAHGCETGWIRDDGPNDRGQESQKDCLRTPPVEPGLGGRKPALVQKDEATDAFDARRAISLCNPPSKRGSSSTTRRRGHEDEDWFQMSNRNQIPTK